MTRGLLLSQSKMVQALTIISALQLFSNAQKPEMESCDGGRGFYRYERMPDVQSAPHSSSSDMVQLSEMPGDVLFKCLGYCMKDQAPSKNRALQSCGSLDFNSGKRYSTYPVQRVGYSDSKCSFIVPDDRQGRPPQYKQAEGHVHYRKVCYSGGDSVHSGGTQDCPERFSVMERLMAKSFLPKGFKKVNGDTLEKCQGICLNQQMEDPLKATDVCRAGTFNHRTGECFLSTYTRRTTDSRIMIDNVDFDYFENTCLVDVERRCKKGKLIFTKEQDTVLTGPYDTLLYLNKTMQECKSMCINHKSIFCRSLEYNYKDMSCVLSEEDSVSKPQRRRSSEDTDLLELKCLEGTETSLSPDLSVNQDRQPLRDRNRLDIPIAFQIYRTRRLESNLGFPPKYKEFNNIDLSTCLNNCLTDQLFKCYSVEYSELTRDCRYSKLSQKDGKFVYDPQVSYFRNTMHDSTTGLNKANNIPSRFRLIFGGDDHSAASQSDSRFSTFGHAFQTGNRFETFNNRFGTNDNQFFGTGSGAHFGSKEGSTSTGSRFDTSNRFGGAFRPFPDRPSETSGTFGPGSGGVITGADHFSPGAPIGGISVGNRFGVLGGGGHQSSGVDFTKGIHGTGSSASKFGTSGTIGSFGTGSTGLGGSTFVSGSPFASRPSFGSQGSFGSRPSFGSQGSFGSRPPFGTGPQYAISPGFGHPAFGSNVGGGNAIGTQFGQGNNFPHPSGAIAEVSQVCNTDGSMEFMLRTADAFYGRIYAQGYYDMCFYRGGGSTVSILNLSPPRRGGNCGTIGYADTSSNIVVVQFANGVETALDKRYNLTCARFGPGDTLVQSNLISSGPRIPTQIEYLPEKSRMAASVRLLILYNGRPTSSVAVGDPLTFRLESLSGRGMVSDIFATDVIAKDPISQKTVELIDSRGCPKQLNVFPALGSSRSGEGLEANFNAFRMPGGTFLVFEARVRMCRRRCEPAYCTDVGPGRQEGISYGRRKRSLEESFTSVNETSEGVNGSDASGSTTGNGVVEHLYEDTDVHYESDPSLAMPDYPSADYETDNEYNEDEEANVNEVIRVFMNEEDAEAYREAESAPLISDVCIQPSEYYSLLGCLLIAVSSLCVSLIVLGMHCRKHRKVDEKNRLADSHNPSQVSRSSFPGAHPRTINQPARYFPPCEDNVSSIEFETNRSSSNRSRFSDPSEPIYTDPTLFEKPERPTKLSQGKEGSRL